MSGGVRYIWAQDEDRDEFEADPGVLTRRLGTIPSFFSLIREAFVRLKDNWITLVLMAAIHLGVTIVVLTIVALVMKISGSPWPGLIAGALVVVTVAAPVLSAAGAYLTLNIWDEGSVSIFEAMAFCRQNLAENLMAYWWTFFYQAGLWLRAIPSLWPGLLMVAILHAALHFLTEVDNLFFWDALVVFGVTLPLAIVRLWERIRRVSTFLYRFTAYEIVDDLTIFAEDLPEGMSGYWRSRFARLFHRLDDEWWQGPLNQALAWKILFGLVWLVPAALIFSSGISPLAAFCVTAIFPWQIRYVLSFWYSVASAGWFRNNLSSGLYY